MYDDYYIGIGCSSICDIEYGSQDERAREYYNLGCDAYNEAIKFDNDSADYEKAFIYFGRAYRLGYDCKEDYYDAGRGLFYCHYNRGVEYYNEACDDDTISNSRIRKIDDARTEFRRAMGFCGFVSDSMYHEDIVEAQNMIEKTSEIYRDFDNALNTF